jgi:hypothetical protein
MSKPIAIPPTDDLFVHCGTAPHEAECGATPATGAVHFISPRPHFLKEYGAHQPSGDPTHRTFCPACVKILLPSYEEFAVANGHAPDRFTVKGAAEATKQAEADAELVVTYPADHDWRSAVVAAAGVPSMAFRVTDGSPRRAKLQWFFWGPTAAAAAEAMRGKIKAMPPQFKLTRIEVKLAKAAAV